jgi:hypothetical protein
MLALPRFPDELRVYLDEFAWRIGRLVGKQRAIYVDKYLLVFYSKAPMFFDRYFGQKLRFGVFLATPEEAVLTVAGKHGTTVLEWGPEEEIMEALETLRRLTVLDDLASI